LVTRRQLIDFGLGIGAIDDRVKRGDLRILYRSVYLLAPTTGPHTWEMAAVLASGANAYLSHQSVGHLYRVLPYVPRPGARHVTVVARNPGRRSGITVHRVVSLERTEVSRECGIPVTSLARTILDLACELSHGDLEQAIAEGFARNRLSRAKLVAQLELRSGHRGAARLRGQLERTPARTRSRSERRLLAAVRRAGLPEPEVNAPFGHWEVDLLWRGYGLAVEVDGYSSHSSPRAFERDHRKTVDLQDAGLRVLRFSSDQLRDDLRGVVARIAKQLGWRSLAASPPAP
jgi:very-short-patch-repair endonuclease